MATYPEPPSSRNPTGLTDSTHSSTSSSAERYRLDEFDETPILLYKYRGGLKTSSQKDLCQWLDKDDTHRVTRKPIRRMQSYVDVKRHDLYLPEEKEMYSELPFYDSNLASIKVPQLAYWNRLLLGNYDTLYIVSHESSGTSKSSDSSATSRSTTWGQDSTELPKRN